MLKKTILFSLLFYFLALIQGSFMIFFDIREIVPNLLLTAIILVNLFLSQDDWSGVVSAFIGGFLLDVFSEATFGFFGFYTLLSLAIAFFIKFVIKKYVHVPFFKKI